MDGKSNVIDLSIVEKEFSSDPLFNLLKRKNKLGLIFDNEYIRALEKLTWYSTTQVAPMCDSTTSNVQYYLRSFIDYLEIEETPSTGNAFKIDYKGVIRLKMIFLLKDEYRVKGLKQELGYESIVKPVRPHLPTSDLNDQQQESLDYLMSFLRESGLVLLNEESREVEVNPAIITRLNLVPKTIELLKESTSYDDTLNMYQQLLTSLESQKRDKEYFKKVLIRTNGLEFRMNSKIQNEQKGFFSIFKKKSIEAEDSIPDFEEDEEINVINDDLSKLHTQIEEVTEQIEELKQKKEKYHKLLQPILKDFIASEDGIEKLGVDQNDE